MRLFALTLLLLVVSTSFESLADDDLLKVTVNEPYLEMHTGPGRGYPVFHVVASGEDILVESQRTDWFRVVTADRRGISGWAHRSEMQLTLLPTGEQLAIESYSINDVSRRKWEWSISGGDFGGASAISSTLGYHLTPNIGVNLEATQVLGQFSDGLLLGGSVQMAPFPHWRASPYFQLGAGVLNTSPHSTIVQAEDRTDNTLNVGGGVNFYLTRRFILFLDYRQHRVLTTRENNEEIDQWKLGINVFF